MKPKTKQIPLHTVETTLHALVEYKNIVEDYNVSSAYYSDLDGLIGIYESVLLKEQLREQYSKLDKANKHCTEEQQDMHRMEYLRQRNNISRVENVKETKVIKTFK